MCTAKKLSSSFELNNDESVILQKLLCLYLERNLLLFLKSVESSSGSVEGSHGIKVNDAITFEQSVFSESHTLQTFNVLLELTSLNNS